MEFIKSAISDLTFYRDHSDEFGSTDLDYPYQIVNGVMDGLRRVGKNHLVKPVPTTLNAEDGLNMLGEVLELLGNNGALLIGKSDIAKLLGISVRTVDRMKSAGELPDPITINNHRKWRRGNIIEHFRLE